MSDGSSPELAGPAARSAVPSAVPVDGEEGMEDGHRSQGCPGLGEVPEQQPASPPALGGSEHTAVWGGGNEGSPDSPEKGCLLARGGSEEGRGSTVQ